VLEKNQVFVGNLSEWSLPWSGTGGLWWWEVGMLVDFGEVTVGVSGLKRMQLVQRDLSDPV
jgi:hypothetical protein